MTPTTNKLKYDVKSALGDRLAFWILFLDSQSRIPGGFSMQVLDVIAPLVIENLVYACGFEAFVEPPQSD